MRFARTMRGLLATTVLTMMAATGRGPVIANTGTGERVPARPCDALLQLALPDTVISSAAPVPPQGSVAGYCKVLATVSPETDIELRLPDRWRYRLLHIGGSGFDGVIPNLNASTAQLKQGYALAASNGGHRDPTGGPTRLLNDPALIEDYAYAAIGKTVHVAKAIIRAYYGRQTRFAYFSGCSNGGRGALNAAAKFGHEYDGVIAGAPTRNASGLISNWVRASLLKMPSSVKLAAMYRAQLAQCDGRDGVVDGIISNPRPCDFDPSTIECPQGVDSDACLTREEVESVNTIRSDLRLANGKLVYSRLGIGNPGTGFGVFMPLGPAGSPTVAAFGAAHLQFIVHGDPTYDAATYDVDHDLGTVVGVLEHTYDFSADTAPLASFLKSGRKVIVWHGAEDTALSHLDTVRAYRRMTSAAGKHSDNARLFTPPGVQHCGGGPGADRFDLIGAMANWVENRRAPEALVASKVDSTGNVRFTRPLCEHPTYPRYVGVGDPNDASSFSCVHPARRHVGASHDD